MICTPPMTKTKPAMSANPEPNGWLVIDKPQGLTSARVVERVHRATGAKAGHAGTLDPLATGVLPVALGEATKTIAYAVNGPKRYRFRIRWGIARSTEDCEGEIVAESRERPSRPEIEKILPHFIGIIAQKPPAYSALKIAGRRSYALARAGLRPCPMARQVEIFDLRLIATAAPEIADLEATVGKGTYIRALARDIAEAVGTLGHIAALRRLSVGQFTEEHAVSLESALGEQYVCPSYRSLLPVEAALTKMPAVVLARGEAARLRCGQRVALNDTAKLSGANPPVAGTVVAAWDDRSLVALVMVEGGNLRPLRVMNL